ncbi:hypothetical protein [Bifidobacterium polysaccharolyticum]|uniref:hypothetical protein n=1 Tax=Bifidobacterium polysaccharolyticum TaxID=2750967 RepID=UPI0021BAD560|nr:hypothetical protein [Bifidobacterium polysaccharolyticum]MCT8158191.1 hypothetical protein [Bifidobacterium polysaccharolyticum]
MSEKQWYEDLPREEIEGKHVRAVLSSGTAIEGRLEFWGKWLVTAGSPIEGNYVLGGSEESRWELTERVECLDLVWDERDWTRIDVRDLRDGDAVVSNGRLYRVAVSWAHEDPPQVVTDTPSRMRIDLSLVSCALRRKRKVHIPAKAGFYKDRTGSYWVRAWMPGHDKPWRAVDPYAFDFPVRSEDEMFSRMPLTPVHFVDGRAPEPGDELAAVMTVTSKCVTFTTEAA